MLPLENTDSGYLILVFHCLLKFMTLCMYIVARHKQSIVSGRDSIVFLTPCGKTSFPSVYIFISIFLIYKCFHFLDSLKQVIISAWFPYELNTILNMYSFIYMKVKMLLFFENYLLTDIIQCKLYIFEFLLTLDNSVLNI